MGEYCQSSQLAVDRNAKFRNLHWPEKILQLWKLTMEIIL